MHKPHSDSERWGHNSARCLERRSRNAVYWIYCARCVFLPRVESPNGRFLFLA